MKKANEAKSYKSLKREGQSGSIETNKSRFFGYAVSADSEEAALSFIAKVKAQHPEASCICHGYICGFGGEIQRFHDGHEPVGGMPILENIKMRGMTNTVCAVARYFGGVKLGAGNLARYFAKAAGKAIDDGIPCELKLSMVYKLAFDYGYLGKLQYAIEYSTYQLLHTEYGEKVIMKVLVPYDRQEQFQSLIDGITNTSHSIEVAGREYQNWD